MPSIRIYLHAFFLAGRLGDDDWDRSGLEVQPDHETGQQCCQAYSQSFAGETESWKTSPGIQTNGDEHHNGDPEGDDPDILFVTGQPGGNPQFEPDHFDFNNRALTLEFSVQFDEVHFYGKSSLLPFG